MKKMRRLIALICVFALTIGLPMQTSYARGGTATVGQRSIVSVGREHTAVIDSNHALWIWGSNEYGQLGNNGAGNSTYTGTFGTRTVTYNIQTVPVKVLENVISVNCGAYFTAAIKADGTLWMWGDNKMGQLGDGTTRNRSVPVKVLDQVIAVSCGYSHTAAIRADGSLWMWGHNLYDQLGTGGVVNSSAPGVAGKLLPVQTVPVKIMDHVVSVSCGNFYTAAIRDDASLWSWGHNVANQLGLGDIKTQPIPLPIRVGIKSVYSGDESTVFIDGSNALTLLGSYDDMQLPQRKDITEICMGGEYRLAYICADSSLWARGYNYKVDRLYNPEFYQLMDNVYAAACSNTHIVTVQKDGSVWAWGFNGRGQIGNGGLGEPAKGSWRGFSTELLQDTPYRIAGIVAAVPGMPVMPVNPTVGGVSD